MSKAGAVVMSVHLSYREGVSCPGDMRLVRGPWGKRVTAASGGGKEVMAMVGYLDNSEVREA